MALVGLDVTYGDAAIGPPRFHRVTVPGGRAANVNRKHFSVGSESKAVYLWAKTSNDSKEGKTITDIQVLYGKDNVPDGYELLDRDLTLGRDPGVYLAFRRDDDEKKNPITDIFIVFDKASIPKDQDDDKSAPWKSIQPSIGGSMDEVHLWIRRKKLTSKLNGLDKSNSTSPKPKWDPRKLEVGDWIDQYDEYNMWRKSTVIAIDVEKNKIRVLQEGYDPQWAKTLSLDSKFIAPFGKHTKGQQSYYWHNQSGDVWKITQGMVDKIEKKLKGYVKSGDHDGMAGSFWEGELPNFVECCLNRRFRTRKEMCLARKAIMMIVHKGIVPRILDTSVPFSTNLVNQLKRVFGADRKCQYFYEKYGDGKAMFRDDDEDELTDDTDTDETDKDARDSESKAQPSAELDSKDGPQEEEEDGMFQIDDDDDEPTGSLSSSDRILNVTRQVILETYNYDEAFDLKELVNTITSNLDVDAIEILSQNQDLIKKKIKDELRNRAAVCNPVRKH